MNGISFTWKGWAMLLVVICPLSLFSQTEDLIKSDLDSLRAGSHNVHDYQLNASNERQVLLLLKKYESDANARVRLHVRIVRAMIAAESADTLVRQQITESFLEDCLLKDPDLSQYSTGRLKDFNEHDFSPRAKQLIVTVFNRGIYSNEFILICGTAQVRELIPQLKKIAAGFNRTKEGWPGTPAWYACLALTRMGEPEKIDTIISAVELELNPVYRVGTLLRFIAYTRHPDCIKLLQKYLESSDRLPSLREGSEGPGINQYALNYLAQYLEGFPVKYKYTGYSPEELQLARAYFKSKAKKEGR